MRIEQSTLETVLAPYTQSCRYLLEAALDYPIAKGTFQIPRSFYLQQQTGHFNAVEMMICYNQLGLALFVEAGCNDLIEGLEKTLTLKGLQKQFVENALIVGMNNVHFKRPIDPTKPFTGRIKINNIIPKKNKTLYFYKTEYDFGEGKATGEVDIALVKR